MRGALPVIRDSDYRNEKLVNINIPCAVLNDRNVAVLEAISEYLKDKKQLTYHEIALLLNRDDRTIWTCYYRAKKKRGGKKKKKDLNKELFSFEI